jgi:hypothetical protein
MRQPPLIAIVLVCGLVAFGLTVVPGVPDAITPVRDWSHPTHFEEDRAATLVVVAAALALVGSAWFAWRERRRG